jgi:hypothetical protein
MREEKKSKPQRQQSAPKGERFDETNEELTLSAMLSPIKRNTHFSLLESQTELEKKKRVHVPNPCR